MNFQAVSVAEKLKLPDHADRSERRRAPTRKTRGSPAGTDPDGTTRRARCCRARSTTSTTHWSGWHDTIQADGERRSTAIIVTAKHGQSPQNPLSYSGSTTVRSSPASTPPGRHEHGQSELTVQEADDDLCSAGSRSARRRRPTSSRTTCGRTAPAVLYNYDGEPDDHRGPALRSGADLRRPCNPRGSSACRTPTRTTRTCSDLAGRHGLHDRHEDRRARRRQPRRPRCAAARLRARRGPAQLVGSVG